MRVSVSLIVIIMLVSTGVAGEVGMTASATIQATAQVVPPVGLEADRDLAPSDNPSDSPRFWVFAPRPGAAYLTLTDAWGEPVCLPSLNALSVLEQHRYRSLLCLDADVMQSSEPLVLTVIYSAD